MKIEDFPDTRKNRYPERLMLAISSETRAKIKALKERGKDAPEILRKALDEALKDVAV